MRPPGRAVEQAPGAWYNQASPGACRPGLPEIIMAKPHRNLKKANHGARPANSKARKQKRKHIRT
jgi:hypothetical protein